MQYLSLRSIYLSYDDIYIYNISVWLIFINPDNFHKISFSFVHLYSALNVVLITIVFVEKNMSSVFKLLPKFFSRLVITIALWVDHVHMKADFNQSIFSSHLDLHSCHVPVKTLGGLDTLPSHRGWVSIRRPANKNVNSFWYFACQNWTILFTL